MLISINNIYSRVYTTADCWGNENEHRIKIRLGYKV